MEVLQHRSTTQATPYGNPDNNRNNEENQDYRAYIIVGWQEKELNSVVIHIKQCSPSHCALLSSGVLPDNGDDNGRLVLSKNIGLLSSPTVLGIRADPSTMAEKFIPMNRKIMSCAISGVSYGTMCDALNIYAVVSIVAYAAENDAPWHK